jgi:methanogenic corrinoid protein MtbC1
VRRDEISRPKCANRILCVPASDEADEITAAMLAQVLEQAGCVVISFPLDASAEQMIQMVEPSESDIICISSLPPFAFARARTLSRNLRSKYPRTKIVIGVWGFSGDTEKALQRFHSSRPDKLVGTLAEAINFAMSGDAVPSSAGPVMSVSE